MSQQQPILLDVPSAAELTGLSERAMRYLFTRRAFPIVTLGTRLYVKRADLLAHIEHNTHPKR